MLLLLLLLTPQSAERTFVAVALELSGAWSADGLEIALDLGRRLTNTTFDKLES